MKKKKNKNPHHHPQANPTPKTSVSGPSSIDMASAESAKQEAVTTEQSAERPDDKKGGEMGKIRWTDKLIAAATFVIAIATAVQGYELITGSRDTHDLATAAVASSRAWVAPEQMTLGSPIESGLPLKYQIRIVNPGKEPALEAVWSTRSFGVPYVSEVGQPDVTHFGPNNTCVGLDPDPKAGMVLYPAGNTNFWIPLDIPDTPENRLLLEAVQKREQSLVIEGCFAYIAATQRHTSAFRFFLRDVSGPSFVNKDGAMVPVWNFNATLDGNQAN